jgi:hypothetical protein
VRFVFVLVLSILSMAASASARTVDFTTLAPGNRGQAVGFEHGLLAETRGGTVVVYGPGGTLPGACPATPSRLCRGELTLIFFAPVRNFTYTLDPRVRADEVVVNLFNGETLVASGAPGAIAGGVSLTAGEINRATLSFSGAAVSSARPGGSLRAISYDPGAMAFAPTVPSGPLAAGSLPPVQTRVLDFSQAVANGSSPRTIRIPGATVSLLSGDGLFLYRGEKYMPAPGGFCALSQNFRCLGDAMIVFDQLIQDLSFETYFYDPGDSVLVQLFAGGLLLTERSITYAGLVSFFGFAGITHVVLIDQSRFESAGMGYGNFRYSLYSPPPPPPPPPPPAVVPVPASAFGLGAGLLALVAVARRRSAREKTS